MCRCLALQQIVADQALTGACNVFHHDFGISVSDRLMRRQDAKTQKQAQNGVRN